MAGLFLGGMLLVLLGVLLFKRKRGGWLLGNKGGNGMPQMLGQKALDGRNRVVLLRYQDRIYLLLLGTTNLVIDSYPVPEPKGKSQGGFNDLLSKNQGELDRFLQTLPKHSR